MMTFRRLILGAALAAFLPSSVGATPQDAHLEWFHVSHPGSCLGVVPLTDGTAFFDVNSLPIPTWLISVFGDLNNTNAKRWATLEAPFRTSILRVGANAIEFQAVNSSGDDSCNNTDSKITLYAPAFGSRGLFLFDVPMHGTPGAAVTEIDLDLAQIDPDLAESIEDLRAAIQRRLDYLDEFGGQADDVLRDRQALEQLLQDLQELIDRGFDQIDPAELDVLCTQYASIAEEILAALKQVVADFKTAIEDLRREIERLSGALHDRVGELDDFSANGPGFGDDDFSSTDSGSLPDVDVPNLGDDPWDDGNDIYDDYATETIAFLSETLSTDRASVLERLRFLEIFNAWRRNTNAIELGLQSRSVVSQEEYGAFLRAKGRVVRFVEDWVDEEGWFKDSPIPVDVKALVQGALHSRNPEKSERIKLALNAYAHITSEEAATIFGLLFTLKELGIAVQMAQAERFKQELEQQENSWWDSTVSFLGNAASVGWDIAVTITPLGDLIDVCEAISGKAGCNLVSGRSLSWKERAFAAAGMFMVGSTSAIRKMAKKVDKIKCPAFLTSAAPGRVFAAPLGCGAKRFFSKLNDTIASVPRRRPSSDRLAGAPRVHISGRVTYTAKNGPPVPASVRGVKVTYNRRGFVDFAARHLKRVTPPRKSEVWIDFLCNRPQEKSAANAAGGFNRTEGHNNDFSWHHTTKFRTNRSTGKVQVKMQLVRRDVHDWARHTGGYGVGKAIVGVANCAN